jgi:acyl carrier protein
MLCFDLLPRIVTFFGLVIRYASKKKALGRSIQKFILDVDMSVTTGTPDGLPYRCPLCGSTAFLSPFDIFGDAQCPNCGTLLFFVNMQESVRVFAYPTARGIRERVLNCLARELGVSRVVMEANPKWHAHSQMDSLQLVELVMELEEEYGRSSTDE